MKSSKDIEIYEGFNAYRTYLAVKNHFDQAGYDFYKYKGKVSVKESTFLKRNDKFFFKKLERNYSKDDLVSMYVGNHVLGGSMWVRDLKKEHMLDWNGEIARIEYTFKNDIEVLLEYCTTNNTTPDEVLRFNIHRIGLSAFSICVFDWLFKFTDGWLSSGNVILETKGMKISKMRVFVVHGLDKKKFVDILKTQMREHSNG